MSQRILLVDDEEGIRKVLGISLLDMGYEALTAESGEEAIQIFKEKQPPIVLTDIKMPGMDGIQLLRKIKEESPDTEVIMITGHGDMELAIQSLKHDAGDFITKPIANDILEIALKRANEKIRMRNELKQYTEKLEQLVEEKSRKLVEAERLSAVGQTVAGLAHAIKNITGGLTGGAYVLEKGIELKKEKYLTQGWIMLKGNVLRIKGLALDLLSYTKDQRPEYRLCDPNKPAREVAEMMHARAIEFGLDFQTEWDDKLPPAWFDPEGIHRCLLNLVTNAVDACTDIGCLQKPGRILLRSSTEVGWSVVYTVEDNGCGMDEETRAKIFRRFFSTKGAQGTGLGLMITKKIIDEHDGIIELESKQGRGTRFVIKLPKRENPLQ